MNKIIFPLTHDMQSDDVANLQDGLLLLLARNLLRLNDPDRQRIEQDLRQEYARKLYARATQRLVGLFQESRRLQPPNGEVDERTAVALNEELEKLGAFAPPTAEVTCLVSGRVTHKSGQPAHGLNVRAFHVDDRNQWRLGEDDTDADGHYTIRYAKLPGLPVIHLQMVAADAEGNSLGKAKLIPDARPLEVANIKVPDVVAVTHYVVEGTVTSPTGAEVDGLRIRVVDHRVGKQQELRETTVSGGAYRAEFTGTDLKGKARPDLQAVAFAADGTQVGASEVRYNASTCERLSILLDAKKQAALPSEYQTLTGNLAKHHDGKLSELKESDEQQDITFLANKTGWDARAVALASLAAQHSEKSVAGDGTCIEAPFFYALFRAGLPADLETMTVYRTDLQTVTAIWNQALEQGIIPKDLKDKLSAATTRFKEIASEQLLNERITGSSTLQELLPLSLGDGAVDDFANLYTEHRNDPERFWTEVRNAFGDEATKRLQIDGKLAHLTLHNAPLMRKLHDGGAITQSVQLVERGLHTESNWENLIGDSAVPDDIPGQGDEKKANYARLLAAQIRLCHPTAVLAKMVQQEIPLLDNNPGRKQEVHDFLMQHHEAFHIGRQPISQFIQQLDQQPTPEVVREIARIQRVYQITPHDEAAVSLLNEGLDSSFTIARMRQEDFVATFKDSNTVSESVARSIHTRAQQVHNTVLNIAVSYLTAAGAPVIGGGGSGQYVDTVSSPDGSVAASATLEKLFGDMDYCDCEHCRSVLSPAAYLVDLLLFLDRASKKDGKTPLTVLLDRRPDLQHLPLTCENTNKPLPYIDLVNEVLEYSMLHDLRLSNDDGTIVFQGHDTGSTVSNEELLANPQYVAEQAYLKLADTHNLMPPIPPLPFHQPLENLRRFFERFDAPLPRVMEALRMDERLERGSEAYGWRDIRIEELRLSRAEYHRLTDETLSPRHLYGYPEAAGGEAKVPKELRNAKAYAQCVDISYDELMQLLTTQFVNPGSAFFLKFQRLGVSAGELKDFLANRISDETFEKALAPRIDASEYGGDIKAWVRNHMPAPSTLITLAGQAGADAVASFSMLELRYFDGTDLRDFEFIRLIHFIRLWRLLGWTIEQTDKAITALYPADQMPNSNDDAVNRERLAEGMKVLLPRLGIIKRVMDELSLQPRKDLLSLLACFAPIDTHGLHSLYRAMFLSPARREHAAFADNGAALLSDPTQKLLAHTEVLRAAFSLTDEELFQIQAELNYAADTVEVAYTHPQGTLAPTILDAAPGLTYDHARHRLTHVGYLSPDTCRTLKALNASAAFGQAVDDLYRENQHVLISLTLDHISAIFRRGWLARKLKLSVREFLWLIRCTGLDPFTISDPTAPPMLRLIELVNRLRAASLKPSQALDLIWNRDLSGKSAPGDVEVQQFARTLRADIAAIEQDLIIMDDPDGQLARSRMALVYGNDATDFFLGLIGNTLVTATPCSLPDQGEIVTRIQYTRQPLDQAHLVVTVSYEHEQPELEQPILDAAHGALAYDHAAKRLTYSGELTDQIRIDLQQVPGVTDRFRDGIDRLFTKTQQVITAGLEQAILDIAPGLSYDAQSGTLCYRGPFQAAKRDAVKALKKIPGIVLPENEAAIFFAEFQTALDSVFFKNTLSLAANLPQSIVDLAPGRIAYDDFRKELRYLGVMSDHMRQELMAVVNPPVGFVDAVKTLDEKIRQQAILPFFAQNPQLEEYYRAYVASQETVVPYYHSQAVLEPVIVDAGAGQLGYDHMRRHLIFYGELTEPIRDALKAIRQVSQEFKQAIDSLYARNSDSLRTFLGDHAEARRLYHILAAARTPATQRLALIRSMLPELKRRRMRQQAVQSLGMAAKVEVELTSALLDHSVDRHFLLHAADHPDQAILYDLTEMATYGLSWVLFDIGPTPEEIKELSSAIQADLGHAAVPLPDVQDGHQLSATWSGYLEAPETGLYNLQLEVGEHAEITLSFNGETCMLQSNMQKDITIWENAEPIELQAGTLYPISFTVGKALDRLAVRWETQARGREVIPARYLYAATLLDHLRLAYIRFLKAASLAAALKLAPAEMAYLAAAHPDVDGEWWLNRLPVTEEAIADTTLAAPLAALLDYARLKAALAPGDERLLTVLKDPTTVSPQHPAGLLFTLTRWEPASLNALLLRFGRGSGRQADLSALKELPLFCRVYDAYGWLRKLGISAAALINAVTNEPTAETVRALQAALRARYDQDDWLSVLRPINDEMRSLQRNALVAYILHQMHFDPKRRAIDTPEKLFEYFLMDVQMEPVVQTSRIRCAISSVQLFIERCLMNLETGATPSAIDAEQWEWMSRYRVWEANRKVFLFPENWLEPELRDNQSPFFKETMSELLQGDITDDRAAAALLSYLSKLEEVAQLEPCGMHYVENDPDKDADDIVHVVARTTGASRKYFYRRLEFGSWTPWEQIKLDIEDTPVLPVVWNKRLFLFWLKILKEGPLTPTIPGTATGNVTEMKPSDFQNAGITITVKAILCWSEYFNGKWQPTRTSDVSRACRIGWFASDGQPAAFNRSRIQLWANTDRTAISICGWYTDDDISIPFGVFTFYNMHSAPRIQGWGDWLESKSPLEHSGAKYYRILRTGNEGTALTLEYRKDAQSGIVTDFTYEILHEKTMTNLHLVYPISELRAAWVAPFFLEDNRHVFYVTTRKKAILIADISHYGSLVLGPGVNPPVPDILFKVKHLSQPTVDSYGPIITMPDSGVVDPDGFSTIMSKNDTVTHVIGGRDTVRFNSVEFSRNGVLRNGTMMR